MLTSHTEKAGETKGGAWITGPYVEIKVKKNICKTLQWILNNNFCITLVVVI